MKKSNKFIIYLIELLVGVYLFSKYFKFGKLIPTNYLEFLAYFTISLYWLGLSMLVVMLTYSILCKVDNNK